MYAQSKRSQKIETSRTYLIDGKHRVLGLFEDPTQPNSFHSYIVVWQHMDTDAVNVTRVDEFGYAFGQGPLLKEVKPYNEYE
jgi:hypothetical protein